METPDDPRPPRIPESSDLVALCRALNVREARYVVMSQDADAARKICEALRAAGAEVWFDQSALVGGDAWDSRIARGFEFWILSLGLGNPRSEIRDPQ